MGRRGLHLPRAAVAFIGIVLGFGIVALLAFVQVSSTPTFCGTCHIMKPYYQSWKHSKHNQIACVECHISPGIGAEARKKFEALSMVAKYFTATYSTKPWAEVDDAACLRCHERRLLEGRVMFHGVQFDHRPHLTEARRGLRLRCTSCHSQMVQGTHLTVTISTCALCHFKGQALDQDLGTCRNCHQVPQTVTTRAGTTFDHAQVARMAMPCTSCHAGIVRGDGNVPRERCLQCHNQPDRLAHFRERDFLHDWHVSRHKIDCQNCHSPIEHGPQPFSPTHVMTAAETGGSCTTCHGSGHSPQRDLYAGTGGRGVPGMPSAMFTTGVTCQGCHNLALSAQTASFGADDQPTPRATAVACMSCHGPSYESIFVAWKAAVDARTNALRPQMEATSGAMGLEPPAAWEDARHNYQLVSRGRGIHNVNFAFALLDKAHEQMNEARRKRGLAGLALPWKSVGGKDPDRCLSCHQGIENRTGTFAGRAFAHGPHLLDARLACAECHRTHPERAPGEIVRFTPEACASCHHRQLAAASQAVCGRCHGDFATRSFTTFRGQFQHKPHLEAGEDCAGCHNTARGAELAPPRSKCVECHEVS
jgi:nitrate/TMAO reductase-like tetraheme cytochrome c subunit